MAEIKDLGYNEQYQTFLLTSSLRRYCDSYLALHMCHHAVHELASLSAPNSTLR